MFAISVLAVLIPCPDTAGARSGEPLSLFRDAEIERTIRHYAEPLFRVNGLSLDRIRIHLVEDDSLNAFVANGRHMFLFSGLLRYSEDPGILIGVIAHEAAHLAAGHLTRVRGAAEDSSAMVVLATLLGMGVGLAGGGEAGIAVAAAGQQIGQRTFTRFSRVQEASADQAALRTLEMTGHSAEGLRDLMVKLAEAELLLSDSSEIPYFLTHPLSTDRMRTMEAHIERSAYKGVAASPDLVDRQRRMVAKIHGFLLEPQATYLAWPDPDESIHAAYAWAIARYRERLMDEAIGLVDGLIAEEPENPWFHELRGQMLYETGGIRDSIPSHRTSVELAPREPLLRINLAKSLLQLDDTEGWREAVEHLDAARRLEETGPLTWSLLGQAFEKLGDLPRSRVARAEMHYLRGEPARARGLARQAIGSLTEESSYWFRANDILAATESPGDR